MTLANELLRHGELESCDGIGYLVSLDDGLPQIYNLESYFRIVKDKSLLRRIIFTSQNLINRAMVGEEDPDQILAGAEETLLKLGESRVKAGLATPREVIAKYEGGVNAFLDPSQRVKGISTGFTKFDEMTGGLHPGELIILAARPSMGKTALALNMAQYVAAKLEKTVAVFSLEMSQESLLTRMLCASARVDSRRFRVGYLQQDERNRLTKALNDLVQAPIYIDDTAGAHLMEMHAKLRRLQAETGTWPGGSGLPAVDVRPRAIRKSQPGNQHDFARHETAGEGTERADAGAVAVKPRAGDAAGRSSPAVERPARIGIDRAGCRRGGVHLPRRSLQTRPRRSERRGRTDPGQAAQRARWARSTWCSCTTSRSSRIAWRIWARAARKSSYRTIAPRFAQRSRATESPSIRIVTPTVTAVTSGTGSAFFHGSNRRP